MNLSERTRLLRRRMVDEARARTIADGLAGFTIEQLCEAVGVSRRTFFNHFASKEDVVLGFELGAADDLLAEFAGGGRVPAHLPPLDSVIELAIDHIRTAAPDGALERDRERTMRHVLDREPALVARFMSATDTQMALVVAALRQRFDWDDPADDRPRLVAEMAAALLKVSAARYFDGDDEVRPFDALLRTNLDLAHNLAERTPLP